MDFEPKKINECAHNLNKKSGEPCMDPNIIKDNLSKYAREKHNLNVNNIHDTIGGLKTACKCDSESCLLTKPHIKNILGDGVIQQQLQLNFKPSGPHDSNDWFSNDNIDDVLKQIAIKYKHKHFLHIGYQMRDFIAKNSDLAKMDFVDKYKKGIRCFGVVFNTDSSYGRGQHWYSIFGDFSKEPFSIEYFNSSGQPPQKEILEWMKKTKHNIEKGLNVKVNDINVSDGIVNQVDNHSCGSYSLYYIISRLEDIPYENFSKNKIGDELMHKFRKYYFFRKH
jgi:hypothetical protein